MNVLFIRTSDVTNSEHKLRQFSITFYFRILATDYSTQLATNTQPVINASTNQRQEFGGNADIGGDSFVSKNSSVVIIKRGNM